MKLVHKMTGLLVVSASAVLMGYGYLTVGREEAMLEQSVASDALLTARVMRRSFLKEYKSEGRDSAFKLMDYASASDEKVKFKILSLPEERSGETLHAPALDHAQIKSLEDGRQVLVISANPPLLQVYLPVVLPNEPPMALLLEESLLREREHVALSEVHVVIATMTLVLLMGTISFVVGSKIVGQPINLLTEKARRVGQGDLSGPLELSQSDEIGELAQAMNRMCEDLARETDRRLEALEQLRHAERLATVGQLASGIAHELGTPLNVVLGRAMMSAAATDNPDLVAENSQIIVEQTERMASIIRQLLDFARRGVTATAPADLRDIVRQLVELLKPLANEAHVRLGVDFSPSEAKALVNASQIEQALTNLVVNAIHAVPEGGEVHLRVEVAGACPPGELQVVTPHVRVTIEDEGGGISEEALPRLFEPFFTTKDVGRGTGLGLPIAHGIVDDHGGWIQVESELGRGSRFSVYLPQIEGATA
ncbi:MAG: HAMP domain-containing histidine kinase [Planctomycetes bacterium]|nr:HAMP domain-containing histidine kinase [Planctomycetota bacterium]